MTFLTGGPSAAAPSPRTLLAATGRWSNALEVPGTGVLNADGQATVMSVSCVSGGNCAAGGQYQASSGAPQAFIVNEINGRWGNAKDVPLLAPLDTGTNSAVTAIACASPGNCAAGGYYTGSQQEAFVANETNGTWDAAEEVPNSGALATDGRATVNVISCPSAGNCVAGGTYVDSGFHNQSFVVNETNGSWDAAEEVPGTSALNSGGSSQVESVSCASTGNCVAGGFYADKTDQQPFVIDEINGNWTHAEEVAGTGTINAGVMAVVSSVSCGSAGNCAAGGYYQDSTGDHAFVVNETLGTWGGAIEVPGTRVLDAGGSAFINSISCWSAGNCSAGGTYVTGSPFAHEVFVVSETNGTWGSAEEMPGTAMLNVNRDAVFGAVSCASAGNCAASGTYEPAAGGSEDFVANETKGSWGKAEEMPGLASLNVDMTATVDSVSCGSNGSCAVGGQFEDGSAKLQALVDTYTPAPTVSKLAPASGPTKGGTVVTITGTNLSAATLVDFGTHAATHLINVSSTKVEVTAPGGTGTVYVAVTTAGGTSGTGPATRYSYVAPPTVTKVSPSSGGAGGGTVVTIFGTNLLGASAVHFGSKLGTHVTVVNAGALHVTTPAGTGTVPVTVTTPGGTSATNSAAQFKY